MAARIAPIPSGSSTSALSRMAPSPGTARAAPLRSSGAACDDTVPHVRAGCGSGGDAERDEDRDQGRRQAGRRAQPAKAQLARLHELPADVDRLQAAAGARRVERAALLRRRAGQRVGPRRAAATATGPACAAWAARAAARAAELSALDHVAAVGVLVDVRRQVAQGVLVVLL